MRNSTVASAAPERSAPPASRWLHAGVSGRQRGCARRRCCARTEAGSRAADAEALHVELANHLTHSWTARGPVPADPQAGVRALDLARTLLPAQRRNRAPRAEQHEQPLQALDAERREQWLWSDGRTARWAHERAHEKALLEQTYFRSRAMRTMCGWRRSGKSTSVGLTS